jgi:hypothetical protein
MFDPGIILAINAGANTVIFTRRLLSAFMIPWSGLYQQEED